MQRFSIFICLATLWVASIALGDEGERGIQYGHLRGRFIYDGEPPKPVVMFARGVPIIDESLLVHPENRGIANVAFWLELPRGEVLKGVHPSYRIDETTPVDKRTKTLRIQGRRIEPHFLLLRTDERLLLQNADRDEGNLKIDGISGESVNVRLRWREEMEMHMKTVERLPLLAASNFHAWMQARVLVQGHPYMAVSDADGWFEIRNLPAGKHQFRSYHETAGYLQRVKRDGVEQPWRTGRVSVTIPADDTLDLGVIYVSPKDLGNGDD